VGLAAGEVEGVVACAVAVATTPVPKLQARSVPASASERSKRLLKFRTIATYLVSRATAGQDDEQIMGTKRRDGPKNRALSVVSGM
jgi:hypothetical protein